MTTEEFIISSRERPNECGPPVEAEPKPRRSGIPFTFTFLICMATWVVLSGKLDLFHLGLGVLSCSIVAFFSSDMLFPSPNVAHLPGVWLRFIRYIPWLIYQIMLANIHLLKLTFHPRMQELINPRIIKFRSRLTSEIAMFVFANSITLTPGTITVFTSIMGTYTVHVIDEKSGDALPGEMEERVARIFGD